MTAKKTQCPFCESIFAVTPEQLSARGGHVRCGKCFQVFKADEHLVLPTPLGSSSAAGSTAVDIFDLLDQPNPHNDESDTLAGQPALPVAPQHHIRQNTPEPQAKASDLGKLEQKQELESDFDALFASLTPAPIDPDAGYVQSKLSSLENDIVALESLPEATVHAPKAMLAQQTETADSANLLAQPNVATPSAAQIQDTPPPGRIPAVVLPQLEKTSTSTKTGASVFNKKHITSAKLSSLKLDDELSDLFLDDNSNSKDLPKHRDPLGVDKLSSTADESWADALLQEEEEAKKAAVEQQVAAVLGSKRPPSVLRPVLPQAATAHPTHKKPTPVPTPSPQTSQSNLPTPPSTDQSTHRSMALAEDDLLSYLSQVGATSEQTDHRATQRASGAAQPQILPPPASHRIKVPVKQRRSAGYYTGWGLLCGVLLLLLATQWLYFNFASLASKPEYNDRLTTLCAMVGCQVPSMDLGQISTGQIRLRRNPDDRNTTQVSLTLTNQANHSQLVPKLKFLQLSDGKVTAYRIVESHEYLQDSDRALKQLLPRQSLKVQFVLAIPRSDVKDYAIDPVY